MTIKDEPIETVVDVVENSENEEEETQAQTIATDESYSAYENGNYGNTSVTIPVERSVLEVATGGEMEDTNERKSDICFCCDHRRACQIVNVIFIFYSGLGLLSAITGFSTIISFDFSQLDDDELVEDIQDLKDDVVSLFWIIVIQQCTGIIFAIIGTIGAKNYNKRLVLAAAAFYLLDLFLCALIGTLDGVIIRGLFSYPHFGLYRALNNGNMTPETYDREKHCCCCPLNQDGLLDR
eukprot:CAMPEP_0116136430 /NCGR_PEP_ID=MMETSP0329-20121206/11717_1 /TAXON_ID=697910 /ORGANISM="Pseudo-nitzschia arenysensis, Strain B593" /LENGTH=237 /DNA_ID=CAMNT_0003631291 /DNA_START=116 /DNA_END=829 /DNA_ORIENTATION=+